MFTQNTIDRILDIPIEQVVGKEVELKRSGSDYKGVCPFHDDKSPSMSVSPTKGIYKCFSCGAGGGVITFIKEKRGYDFIETVKYLGENHNITLEYEEEATPLTKKTKDGRAIQAAMVEDAQQHFLCGLRDSPEAILYVKSRDITPQMAKYFGVGYAPTGNLLRSQYITEGKIEHAAEIGLIRIGDKASYDAYQDRIIVPIHSHTGKLLGWGGRVTPTNESPAKYINPSESWLYNKTKVLYNLNRAIPHIKEAKRTAFLTEGYLDVIGLSRLGILNTVASCGTAFTIEQAKLLSRFADKVYLFFDGDNAGRKATFVAAEILISIGVAVSVINILDADPDDFSRQHSKDIHEANEKITNQKKLPAEDSAEDLERRLTAFVTRDLKKYKEHFLDWAYAHICAPDVEYSIPANKKTTALLPQFRKHATVLSPPGKYLVLTNLNIAPLLEGVPCKSIPEPVDTDEQQIQRNHFLSYVKLFPEMVQNDWTKKLAKLWSYPAATIRTSLKSSAEIILKHEREVHIDSTTKKLPKDCDIQFLTSHGFAPRKDNSGYYFLDGTGDVKKVGTYVLKPLFHIYGKNNQRYVEVANPTKTIRILIDSKEMVTVDRLTMRMWDENFVTGNITKNQHIILMQYWSNLFPQCRELTTLGWQDAGFFAFSNKVFNGTVGEFDDLGIFRHEKRNYLSPSTVESFSDLAADEKLNENDNYLEYKQSPVDLEHYLQMYADVYKQRAVTGIAFIMMSVFRDIAIKSGSIPLLYCYGNTTAGKSEFVNSILHFFFSGKSSDGKLIQPYQVSTGTRASRYAHMERFTNTMTAYNEVDVATCGEDIIKEFKGVFDGEGRSKQDGFTKKTITSYARSCIALLGQFLYTGDEGSVVNRSILEKFGKPNFTQEDEDRWKEFHLLLDGGVSSLVTDFLRIRDTVASKYAVSYNITNKDLRTETSKHTKTMNSRLINNYSHILTLYKIVGHEIHLPFTYEYVWDKVLNDILDQNDQFTEYSVTNEFWEKVGNMLAYRDVKIDVEVKLENITSTLVKARKNKTETKNFQTPVDVLYINMSAFHEKYKINARKTGDTPMSAASLSKHIKDHDAYIGTVPATQFPDGARTSAFMFDIAKLPTDLAQYFVERESGPASDPIQELKLYITGKPEVTDRAGVRTLKFKGEHNISVGKYQSYICITDKLDILLELHPQTCLEARGEVVDRQFTPADGDKVEYKQFIISEVTNITQPEVLRESLAFENTGKSDGPF